MTKLTILDRSDLVRFKATPRQQRGHCALWKQIAVKEKSKELVGLELHILQTLHFFAYFASLAHFAFLHIFQHMHQRLIKHPNQQGSNH